MSNLMVFEKVEVEVAEIDGVPMFELYSTGMALGQVKSAKGRNYPNKERIDKNVENAEIKPVVRNAQRWITESQLYELMLEVKTDKVRPFRKWITNEVLPSLRKTGSYSMTKKPAIKEPDEAIKPTVKFYRGQQVMTIADIERYVCVSRHTLCYHLNHHDFVSGVDYFYLTGAELRRFKQQNPGIAKTVNQLAVVTKRGLNRLIHEVLDVSPEKLKTLPVWCKNYGKMLDADMELKMKYVKMTEAKLLYDASREIMDPFHKEYIMQYVTQILIDCDAWDENWYGYDGPSTEFRGHTLEGWNKMALMSYLPSVMGHFNPIDSQTLRAEADRHK